MTQYLLLSEPKQLIDAIVFCLNSIIQESQAIQAQPSIFDLKNKPTISLPNYLMRICSYMGCSLSAYIYSLILIDKVQQENPGFKITQKNIHRLLFTAIVVAAKFIEDKFYKNKYYATVGGISVQQLNEQQSRFLSLLNYHCPADSDLFHSYLQRLENFHLSKIQAQQSKDDDKTQPQTPSIIGESPKPKKRQVRQKRQRSRQKNHQRNYQTQQSHQIDTY